MRVAIKEILALKNQPLPCVASYAIKHKNGTFFSHMSSTGPRFGVMEAEAARFGTYNEAVAMSKQRGFGYVEIVDLTTRRRKPWINKRRKIAERQGWRCYWCGQPVIDWVARRRVPTPDNAATIDHLHSRLSPERGKHHGEYTLVVACNACNNRRGEEEQRALGIEAIRERSNGGKRT